MLRVAVVVVLLVLGVAPPAAASGTVVVRLPADALPRGDYFFLVEGLSPGREPAPLPRYDFRVVRD